VQVGDPKQLPATVLTRDKTAQLLYRRSVFERLQQAGHPTLFLDTQYRMHPEIADFPSRSFYGGRLNNAPSTLARARLGGTGTPAAATSGGAMMARGDVGVGPARSPLQRCRWEQFSFAMGTYVVLDAPFSEVDRSAGKSRSNEMEARIVVAVVRWLVTHGGVAAGEVGVVTPYKAQVRTPTAAFGGECESNLHHLPSMTQPAALGAERALREACLVQEKMLLNLLNPHPACRGMEVHTVDGFQVRDGRGHNTHCRAPRSWSSRGAHP
jgi:hypothetical protein